MPMITKVSIALLALLAVFATSWKLQQNPFNAASLKARVSSVVCAGCLLLSQAPATLAAVGEGDLPDGALAFSKLIKYQGEWDKLAASVKSRQAEIDDKEVMGIKIFLKQLANEYYDMDLLSKGIVEADKATAAKELAKNFRKQIRECDDAAGDGNLGKIVENYPPTAAELKEFFTLLQDVPDEL